MASQSPDRDISRASSSATLTTLSSTGTDLHPTVTATEPTPPTSRRSSVDLPGPPPPSRAADTDVVTSPACSPDRGRTLYREDDMLMLSKTITTHSIAESAHYPEPPPPSRAVSVDRLEGKWRVEEFGGRVGGVVEKKRSLLKKLCDKFKLDVDATENGHAS